MPLYNPETQTKECSKCHEHKAADQYFKVQAMKDGMASRCKACYYLKDAPEVAQARSDAAMEKKYVARLEAEPIKDRPDNRKVHTHSDAEIKAIEKSTGQKFKKWFDMGDSWVPVFGKAAP